MRQKIALKRLSASDLTLFEYHFRRTSGTKQKAFNLDSFVLVKEFYPSLPDVSDSAPIPIDLSLFGPGTAQLHNLQRKILKQQKNWRLDGEMIYGPPDDPNRYGTVAPGDFAILVFSNGVVPKATSCYLISQGSQDDREIHAVILDTWGASFSTHRAMVSVSPSTLSEALTTITLPLNHPLNDILDSDALEDASRDGFEGTQKLFRRQNFRKISREELLKGKSNAEAVGYRGETLVSYYLEELKANGEISDYEWVSDTNAIAPHDFTVQMSDANGGTRYVDVKSTSGRFENAIHISAAELIDMSKRGDTYDIFRMSHVFEERAELRIARSVGRIADEILAAISALPDGVSVDSVSIKASQLRFESPIDVTNFDD